MYGFLDEAGSQIHDALIDALDQRYRIEKEAEVDDDDGEYNCTIEVRRGMRVGTDVDIEWKVSNRHATIGVDTCTKLDMIILVTTVFLGIASAFMAKLMEIPLFDLFPDIKIGIRWIPPCGSGPPAASHCRNYHRFGCFCCPSSDCIGKISKREWRSDRRGKTSRFPP